MTTIALVGNPNSGKTTVFNGLTGSHQKVGNWPGVTVEKKQGHCLIGGNQVQLIDLPGVYSLGLNLTISLDEQIATDYILSNKADVILNVIDASNLERHLYLTSLLLELGIPMVIALNMTDIAKQRKINIDVEQLSKRLNCPVVEIQANKRHGFERLTNQLAYPAMPTLPKLPLPQDLSEAVNTLAKLVSGQYALFQATHYLMTDAKGTDESVGHKVTNIKNQMMQKYGDELDIVFCDARYEWVHEIMSSCQQCQGQSSEYVTAKVDSIVLHRYFAIPIFLVVMYTMFLFAINIGGAFQDFFDMSTDALFVKGVGQLLTNWHWPNWSIALIANGIGKGINTTLTFIPVIAAMFFFLSLLEGSGYMARAAFIMDRLMRYLGLPGKSFVPMIVGFGCNVPAIMAARTLETRRDQILTVLMSPYMACSARLAIFAVFVVAFFPSGGQNIVFLLYFIGIGMAVLTGLILRKTVLHGEQSSLILELPPYHVPSIKRLIKSTGYRLKFFLTRAGKFIIPICVLLGGLNALTVYGGITSLDASNDSVLSLIGKMLTPLFAPMGLSQENWPATVGLLTGALAKEVVVGSLNSLYSQLGSVATTSGEHFHLATSLKQAWMTIPENLANLKNAFVNPIVASSPGGEMSTRVYGTMNQYFNGGVGAFAYLLFVLLYLPCVSTIAAIRQETNKRWMWFSVIWSTALAYVVAVVFYQLATINEHPMQSIMWVITVGLLLTLAISWLNSNRESLLDKSVLVS